MIYLILYAFVVCSLLSSDIAGVKPILSLPTPKINQTRPTTPNQQASVNLTFPENLFSCPEFPPFDCPEEVENECENHKQCAILNRPDWDVSFMCCKDSCEKRCVPGKPNFDGAQKIMMENYIAQAKQLSCPAKPSRNDCTTKSAHKCSLDIECMTDKNQTFKCCSNGCENECIAGLKSLPQKTVNPTRPNTTKQPASVSTTAPEIINQTRPTTSTQPKSVSLTPPKKTVNPTHPSTSKQPATAPEIRTQPRHVPVSKKPMSVTRTSPKIDNKTPPTTSKQPKSVTPTQPKIINQTVPVSSKQPKTVPSLFERLQRASYCPIFPPAEECPSDSDHECLVDSDCHGLMKQDNDVFLCCIDGCEKRCIPGIPK